MLRCLVDIALSQVLGCRDDAYLEFCDRPDRRSYELFPQLEEIEHPHHQR